MLPRYKIGEIETKPIIPNMITQALTRTPSQAAAVIPATAIAVASPARA